MRRLARVALFAVALAAPAACVKGRSINKPFPDALDRVLADSVPYVMDALEAGISDEGVHVELTDRTRGLIESRYTDLAAVHTFANLDVYSPEERMIKYRFWVRPTFGGTRVRAEAAYRPTGIQGRFAERMVPADHPARRILERMLERTLEHAREAKARREAEARREKP